MANRQKQQRERERERKGERERGRDREGERERGREREREGERERERQREGDSLRVKKTSCPISARAASTACLMANRADAAIISGGSPAAGDRSHSLIDCLTGVLTDRSAD